MNICFLGDAGSVHLTRWCSFFRDHGDKVSIISFRKGTVDGVSVADVGRGIDISSEGGNKQYLKKVPEINRILNGIKPDIINAHFLTSYGLIGALTGRRPLVVSTWGSDILVTPKKNAVYKNITKYVIRKADMLTSDSEFMSSEIIKLGCSKNKILTVPMGIEPGMFNVDGRDDYSSKIIVSMRTLCTNSNIDIIIKAFSMLSRDIPDAKLVISNTGERQESLSKMIKDMGLGGRVTLLGFVGRNQIINLLKTSRVYVSVPSSDSTSVTLLEAMACGTFPVLSNIPANREWVKDGYNGIIVEKGNVEQLYRAFLQSMTDDNLVRDASVVNNAIINERAQWDKNMNLIRDSYMKLAKVSRVRIDE